MIFAELHEETMRDAEQHRDLDVRRVDVALNAIWEDVRNGKLMAIDRMDKLLERRAKLLGYEPPKKVALTDPTGEQPLDFSTVTTDDLQKLHAAVKAGMRVVSGTGPSGGKGWVRRHGLSSAPHRSRVRQR